MKILKTEPFIINRDSLEQQFKENFTDTDSHRILFSGPFEQSETTSWEQAFGSKRKISVYRLEKSIL